MPEHELGFPEHLEVANLYPHEPIAKDMAIDLLGVAERETHLPQRVRKKIKTSKNYYVMYAQSVGTTFAPGQYDYEDDLGSPELFSDMHADALHERVARGAEYLGGTVMHDVVRGMSFRYQYSPIVRIDNKRMSVIEWAEKIWAPDYTERFVAAATMFDAQELGQ